MRNVLRLIKLLLDIVLIEGAREEIFEISHET